MEASFAPYPLSPNDRCIWSDRAGASYPGLHPAIIDRDLFDAVQAIIAGNRQREHRARSPRPHLLAGKVFDEAGEPLIGTHSTKGKVRYRYYTSQSLSQARTTAGMRIPARDLETLVIERLAQALDDPLTLLADAQIMVAPHLLLGVIDQARSAAASLRKRDSMLVRELVSRVTVGATQIEVVCSVAELATSVGIPASHNDGRMLTLTSLARIKRSGYAVRLVQPSGDLIAAEQNRSLLRLLARARRWWGELRSGQIDATRLAAREGVTRSYLLRVTRLAFLSPAITEQILHGRQSAGFTPAALTAPDAVVGDWKSQAEAIVAAGRMAA